MIKTIKNFKNESPIEYKILAPGPVACFVPRGSNHYDLL